MMYYSRWLAKKLWGVSALLLISLALLVQVGREFLPLIDDYRQPIADYFSRSLNLQVSIGQIEGVWDGLAPKLTLNNLSVQSVEHGEVLHVDEGVMQIDFLQTLINRQVSWRDIEFSGVSAIIEQQTTGTWLLQGMADAWPEDAPTTPELNLLELLGSVRHLKLHDIGLSFIYSNGRHSELQLSDMQLEHGKLFQRLVADIDLPEQSEAFKLVLEGTGDAADLDSYRLNGYIQLTDFPLKNSTFIAQSLPQSQPLAEGVVNLSLWLSMAEPRVLTLSGDLAVEMAAAGAEDANQLSARIQGGSDLAGQWLIMLDDLSLNWGGQQSPSVQLQLQNGDDSNHMVVRAKSLDLQAWHEFIAQQQWFGERLDDVLTSLKPRGYLTNVDIKLPLDNPAGFVLSGNLEQVAVDAWHGAPALTGVNGYVQAHATGGLVELDSNAGFSMYYPQLYSAAMAFEQARGQVAWTYSREQDYVRVNSGRLSMRDPSGNAEGYFALDVPWFAGSRSGELTLQIGLRDAPAATYSKYVPKTVPEATRSWLDSSIKSGQVTQAGFVYRGYLDKSFNLGQTVQLLVDVDEASLRFHPDWPEATDVAARVLLNDGNLQVVANRARLLDSDTKNLRVSLQPNTAGEGSLLQVNGELHGPAENGLDLLRTAALKKTLGDTFDSWHLSGDMQGHVELDIPLTAGAPGEGQDIRVALPGNNLRIDSLNLDVNDLNTELTYSNSKGLQAESLSAQVWGHTQQGSITSVAGKTSTAPRLTAQISLQGQVDSAALARWSKRPELRFVEGQIPYTASIQVPLQGALQDALQGESPGPLKSQSDYAVKLLVKSDLKGVVVALPEPYGKQPDQARKLQFETRVKADQVSYDLVYQAQPKTPVYARFEQQQGRFLAGAVSLGEPIDVAALRKQAAQANQEGEAALRISGRAQHLILGQLQEVLHRYEGFSAEFDQPEPVDSEPPLVAYPLVPVLDLSVARFDIGKLQLDELTVVGKRQQDSWFLRPVNDVLAVDVTLFDDGSPLNLAFDYLHLPDMKPAEPLTAEGAQPVAVGTDTGTEVAAVVEESVLAQVKPSDLVPMDIKLDLLTMGGKDFGNWSFKLRPLADGVQIDDLQGRVRGMQVSGLNSVKAQSGKQGQSEPGQREQADLFWRIGETSSTTHINAVLTTKDFADVLEAWGQPRSIKSKKAQYQANLEWSGSPADAALNKLRGDIKIAMDDGSFSQSPGASNSVLLRLMGLFNFDIWARRLKLDFSDTYQKGTVYDHIEGRLTFNEGKIMLHEPLRVKTPSAQLSMAGIIDIENEQLDTTLVATLPVGGNLTMLAAFAGGLPAAAGVYAISKIFKKQVEKVASVSYLMTGSWADPDIEFERLFDSKAAERAATDVRAQNPDRQTTPAAVGKDSGATNE